MRPVHADEIVDLDRYAGLRTAWRDALMRHKQSRRLAVGEKVTLVFEDRETLRFQVQEMCWIERIASPARVQEELDVYNELVPGDGELSATLFVEITDRSDIRAELDRLIGIDEHVALALDDERIAARFDPKQMEEDRISAVQYIRFRLTPAQVARFGDPDARIAVHIDHPNYRREAPLPAAVRTSLAAGLAGDPPPLLAVPPDAASAAASTANPVNAPAAGLFETARVRAYRAARPLGVEHVVVEPRDPEAGLLTADPELAAEILEAVRRAAADVTTRHGRCRVTTEVGPLAGPPRWHVYAPRD